MGNAETGLCCSLREKSDGGAAVPPRPAGARSPFVNNEGRSPQFSISEVQVAVDRPKMMAYGPLWQHRDGFIVRRLVVASNDDVHVYRIPDDENSMNESNVPQLILEHTLTMSSGNAVHAILFTDESSSRRLAISEGPVENGKYNVNIWNCDMPSVWTQSLATGNVLEPIKWDEDEAAVYLLEGHTAPVLCIGSNIHYLVTADTNGQCCVWQKQHYTRKDSAKLHQDGVLDLSVDKNFAYTIASNDCCVCIWSLPNLSLLSSIPIEIPDSYVTGVPDYDSLQMKCQKCQLQRLTRIKRPVSRWSSLRACGKEAATNKTPLGVLYVAAVAAEGVVPGHPNAGLILEWSLGREPVCRSATIAHDSPILGLEYGPYDNGPLLTCDGAGVFHVWDCVPALHCSQEVALAPSGAESKIAIAVDPRVGLYTAVGNSKISVWKQVAVGYNC